MSSPTDRDTLPPIAKGSSRAQALRAMTHWAGLWLTMGLAALRSPLAAYAPSTMTRLFRIDGAAEPAPGPAEVLLLLVVKVLFTRGSR